MQVGHKAPYGSVGGPTVGEFGLGTKSKSQGPLEWMPRRKEGEGLRKLQRGALLPHRSMTGQGVGLTLDLRHGLEEHIPS